MSSPSKLSFQNQTPVKSSIQMKLISSPDKKSVDIYSQLCRSPSNHHQSSIHSYQEHIQPPSWSQYSSSEHLSSSNQQENKENEVPNKPQKQCFDTVKKSEKKGCHCEKSHCQKKYCDCFKIGIICSDSCECIGCENKEITEFHIKSQRIFELTKSGKGGKELKCNCQKSKCMKNYCECRNAGRNCTPACHCLQCDNRDEQEMGLYGRKRKPFMEISEWNSNNILFN